MNIVTSIQKNTDSDIEEAQRVLNLEAEALKDLSSSLGDAFSLAIEKLENIAGRIVITGMGKSGHIACKIASTLASTGSPAFFVHPSEASHGDLGMITKDDAVIALSNSGETSELANVIKYTRRYEIPLIAITSNQASALSQAADVSLVLPAVGEACPIGLAPTTSTTMMVALGDAIAATLLKRKGFSSTDFSVFHPGGSLGNRLVCVENIMRTGDDMPLVNSTSHMSDALLVMTAKSLGCVGAIDDDGILVGVITDGDLRRHMDKNLLDSTVQAVMTPKPKTIRTKALVPEVIAIMNKSKITSMFVCDDDQNSITRPIGIVHIHDCLREN